MYLACHIIYLYVKMLSFSDNFIILIKLWSHARSCTQLSVTFKLLSYVRIYVRESYTWTLFQCLNFITESSYRHCVLLYSFAMKTVEQSDKKSHISGSHNITLFTDKTQFAWGALTACLHWIITIIYLNKTTSIYTFIPHNLESIKILINRVNHIFENIINLCHGVPV